MELINKSFQSVLPTEVVFGKNIVKEELANKLKSLSIRSVLLVSDAGLKSTGIIDDIVENLTENEIKVVTFTEVNPNPETQAVHKGREIYIHGRCEAVVAVGGGSSIDAGKAISVSTVNEGDINNYGRGKRSIAGPIPPLFMIPTTAGTGSEVTNVAVISDPERNKKFVLASRYLYPTCAFIDPILTYSLPQKFIAATGMDALVHSIESYVNNRAQPISDALALEAIKMLRRNLPVSYADPSNEDAKAQVLLASTIAGLSFSMSGTALVHSMSHPVTAWFGVPHGLANAIILPYVIEFNLIANYEKYAEVAYLFDDSLRQLPSYQAAERLIDCLKEFSRKLNIPKDFSYLTIKVTKESIDNLTIDALNERGTFPNNPRKATKDEVSTLYQLLFPQAK